MALLYFGHFRMQYNGSSQCAVTRKQLQFGSCSLLLFGYIEYMCAPLFKGIFVFHLRCETVMAFHIGE
jgi:hypothetical protein